MTSFFLAILFLNQIFKTFCLLTLAEFPNPCTVLFLLLLLFVFWWGRKIRHKNTRNLRAKKNICESITRYYTYETLTVAEIQVQQLMMDCLLQLFWCMWYFFRQNIWPKYSMYKRKHLHPVPNKFFFVKVDVKWHNAHMFFKKLKYESWSHKLVLVRSRTSMCVKFADTAEVVQ